MNGPIPKPTPIYRLMHLDNLETILQRGFLHAPNHAPNSLLKYFLGDVIRNDNVAWSIVVHSPWYLPMLKPEVPPLQPEPWVPACKSQRGPTAPFWDRFQEFLSSLNFNDRVSALCAKHYAVSGPGHPGVGPAVYFKMLLIGFFENNPSERALELRCAASLSIREFLGYEVTERTPDHSTLSRIRKRLPATVYDEVFAIALPTLDELGLIEGTNLGMDTSGSMRTPRRRHCTTGFPASSIALTSTTWPVKRASTRRIPPPSRALTRIAPDGRPRTKNGRTTAIRMRRSGRP